MCEVLLLLQVKCLIKFAAFFISIFWLFKNLNCIIKSWFWRIASERDNSTENGEKRIKKQKNEGQTS